MIAELLEFRNCRRVRQFRDWTPRSPWLRTWDRVGLESLVENAAREFAEKTGIALPYNLSTHGPWVGYSRFRVCTEHRDEMVTTAAKAAGFLRTLAGSPAEYRLALRLLDSGLSPRGMNSPHTVLDLHAVAYRFSPGGLCRWLRKVIRRADAILKPYGLRASWQALCQVAGKGDRRMGKAAVRAAAWTTYEFCCRWCPSFRPDGDEDWDRYRGWPDTHKTAIRVLQAARGLAAVVALPVQMAYRGCNRTVSWREGCVGLSSGATVAEAAFRARAEAVARQLGIAAARRAAAEVPYLVLEVAGEYGPPCWEAAAILRDWTADAIEPDIK